MFRIVEHTNYHLSSILTDNGYGLEKCGVVGGWNLTTDTRELCMKEKMSEGLFLKNGNSGTGYVMVGESVIGIKRQGLSQSLFLPLLSKGGLKVDLQNEKCVMVIDENLPLGIIANTAAIMGITLGKQVPEVVGADVYDRTGNGHLGIIEFPVPILKGNVEVIKSIREKLYEPEFSDLTVVDFSDLAQGCKTYDEFIEKMKDVSETELNYFGIAICGAKKKVNKLTGSMALLR